MTEKEAKNLYKTKWWEILSNKEIVGFQLFENRLCMPFDIYHRAVEKVLGRPVWTHEFGLNIEGLRKEFKKGKSLTLKEIIELMPEEKQVFLVH